MKRPTRPQIRQHSRTPGRFSGRRGRTAAAAGFCASGELLLQLHMRMMPSKRSKWNLDPSRAPGTDARGIAAGGHGDRAVPQGFAGSGDWLHDADEGVLAGGRRGCNSAARGHNASTGRTSRGIRRHDKTAAVEPLPHVPPCAFAGGTGQRHRLRGRLELLDCGDLTKVAIAEPRCFQQRGSGLHPAFEVTLTDCSLG
jgi:hypothetical protein